MKIQLFSPKGCKYRCVIYLVHKIMKLRLASSLTTIQFVMIKVRSCEVSSTFSAASFLWNVPLALSLNESDM